MNKIFVFFGFFAICNAATLRWIPASDAFYSQPYLPSVSVVRSAHIIPLHSDIPPQSDSHPPASRSADLSSDALAGSSDDTAVQVSAAPAPVVQLSAAPAVQLSDAPIVQLSAAPAVVSSLVPSAIPVTVSEAELADWEAYKGKFGKPYASPIEDRYRRNLYFATKTRVSTHNELFNHGLAAEPLQIDIFADQTRDEIFSLRSILDENQDEWNDFKLKYGKLYDTFEDRFRRTVYFIRKDTFADRNLLFQQGLSSYAQAIDNLTDYFDDELPSGVPAAVQRVAAIPAIQSRAFVPAYQYGSLPEFGAYYY